MYHLIKSTTSAIIKTHGSEARSQETNSRMAQNSPAATSVSYLHVGTVLQFSSGLCNYSHKICTVWHEPQFILSSASSQYSRATILQK